MVAATGSTTSAAPSAGSPDFGVTSVNDDLVELVACAEAPV
jgi:hypothetical protein